MVGMSGKAMRDAVPPAGTAIREAIRGIEQSEGHVAGVCGLLGAVRDALAEPKHRHAVSGITLCCKYAEDKELQFPPPTASARMVSPVSAPK